MSTQQSIAEIVGEVCGFVSVCWDPPPAGVFDSTRAAKAVEEAVHQIMSFVEDSNERLDGQGA
jgi:hypothetical protein